MTEYLDRYPTMHEYAEGKRINPKLTDLISRADVLKYPIRLNHYDEVNGSRLFVYGVESVIEYVESLPSANYITEKPNDAIKPSNDVINRADAIDAVMKHKMPFSIQQEVAREIDALPSADTVPIEKYHELQHQFVMLGATFADLTEVVRCKDCKNWRESHSEDEESYCYIDGRTTDSTDYCSWGERR